MKTVSQVVEGIIQRSPFIAEAMAEGLANNAQVARRIKPEVEKILLEEVSEGSIAMALHRIGKASETPAYGTRFLKQMSDITVRSN
ncbi:MAG: aspartate kinase, partial [bacterium]|nr:aspartate kinase [bacterium]